MARIPEDDLERLKRNVSLAELCRLHGIELKPHGRKDLIGKCPFHEDANPSFVVSPDKNLFHCLGCDAAGSVIDLVMKLDKIEFREAVDKLLTASPHIRRATMPEKTTPTVPPERAAQLFERVVAIYEKNFADPAGSGTSLPEGKRYLESRGISDAGLFSRHRVGFCTGQLKEILPNPGNGAVDFRKDLTELGIFLDAPSTGSGHVGAERFKDCVVFPVLDVDGNIVTLYGRYIHPANGGTGAGKRHVFLPDRSTGLWNAAAMKTYSEIILVESVIDALSVIVAGQPNVIAIQGTNGLNDADIRLMAGNGVRKLTLLLDGDEAGIKAVRRLKGKIQTCCETIGVTIKTLPDGEDPNSFLVKHGAEKLAAFLNMAESGEASPKVGANGAGGQTPPGQADGFSTTYGLRKYRIMGLDKSSRKLKATVRVEHTGKLHVDTLDFYSARSRRILAQDVCRIFEETPETIEADITRLMRECEAAAPEKRPDDAPSQPVFIGDADKKEAETFGRSKNLMQRILADYEICGLIGEAANKLLSYLAAISRKMDTPLSALILSSSGAGKTALQDAALSFVPPEDLVKLTALSGKALFYKERLSLKNKVLSLEEGDGAEEASYAIRNLISAGELIIESAIKDPASGKIITMVNRVEGPTAVFLTTTNPDTDAETKTRFFVTSIDESREQTRKIMEFQRQRQTLKGITGNLELNAVLRRHHNFQRLLKPLAVVNPWADRLSYGDDRLQGRRDQPKYLSLIKAVAFLRQMTKEVHTATRPGGTSLDYIEADLDDLSIANKLAHEILGHSLDELSRPGRDLLMLLDELIEKRAAERKKDKPVFSKPDKEEYGPQRTQIGFTRREVREFTGWANARVHRYLKELVDLEYVLMDTGRNGSTCRYRLAYEGQGKDGKRFMLGLKPIEELLSAGDGKERNRNANR